MQSWDAPKGGQWGKGAVPKFVPPFNDAGKGKGSGAKAGDWSSGNKGGGYDKGGGGGYDKGSSGYDKGSGSGYSGYEKGGGGYDKGGSGGYDKGKSKGAWGKDTYSKDTWSTGKDSYGGNDSWGADAWSGGGSKDSWGAKDSWGGKDSWGSKDSWGGKSGKDEPMLVLPPGKGGKGTVRGASNFVPAPKMSGMGGMSGPSSDMGPSLVLPPGGGPIPGLTPYGTTGLLPPLGLPGSAPPPPGGMGYGMGMGKPSFPQPNVVMPPGRHPPPPSMMPAPGMLALPGIVPPPPGGVGHDFGAFVAAAEVDDGPAEGKVTFPPPAPKPKLFLLIHRIAAEVEESQLQEILEQCGSVQAFRRARDEKGTPLSFGFAQFADPEAAWKASVCLTGLKLKGQELKVLVEEAAEARIAKWRSSQQAALKVSNEEELSWELERKSVSTRSQIDAKVAEIFGGTDESGGAYIAQKKQELREREQTRVERVQKRKAWRDAEFAKELEKVESKEKKFRAEELEKDEADRVKEMSEVKKEDPDLKPKLEDKAHIEALVTRLADDQQLWKMVDRVQAEPRETLFKLHLDAGFLRNDRIFEQKLRPWLNRKIELFMGGAQSDMVEYIIRRVNSGTHPEALMSDLMRFLDDNAEPTIERMWRMLAFELHRGGVVLQEPLKWEES